MLDKEDTISEEFQRRRRRDVLALLVMLVSIVWAATVTYDQPGGPLGSQVGIAALGVVLACFLFHFFNWRCPACGRYLGRFRLQLRSCGSCGASLAPNTDVHGSQ